MMNPAKRPKPSVPEPIKAEVADKARDLIENILKPRYVRPPEPGVQYNYITDLTGKWSRGYFYFIAIFACPGPNALSSSFESNFARMEFLGDGKFSLSYQRHTGAWMGIYAALSVDQSFKAIQEDPWFQL